MMSTYLSGKFFVNQATARYTTDPADLQTMNDSPPTQKTLGPLSMVFAPTAVLPESLILDWNTAY